MNKLIQFGMFSYYSEKVEFAKCSIKQLIPLPQSIKATIQNTIFTTPELYSDWEDCNKLLNESGIESNISTKHTSYLERTYEFLNNGLKYSCRLDDDLFISSHLFEFMFNHLYLLDNPNSFIISPLFSTGIPSVDFFIEDFLDMSEKETIYKLFIKSSVPETPWHPECNYSDLREFVFNMKTWDWMEYYTKVNAHNTAFKGIHPIRFDEESNTFLSECIISKLDKIFEKQNYEFMESTGIHNTHPFIRTTEQWKRGMETMYDSFDEICTNVYALENNLATYFVKNGFAIHLCHGYVPNRKTIEKTLSSSILNYKSK